MQTFHETLWDLKNDELSMRLRLLDVKLKRINKGTLVDAIKTAYAGDGLRRIWESLSPLQQTAVAEAVWHPDHKYDAQKVAAKYGESPAFYDEPEGGRRFYGYQLKDANRLNLLLFSIRTEPGRFVPADLADRLREFVPEPEAAAPPQRPEPPEEEGLVMRETAPEAVAEVMALLRLAESGDLRVSEKTALPSAAGIRKILGVLPNGDFYPPEIAVRPGKESWEQEIGAIKPVGWARMLHTAGLVDVRGAKSKLTPKGMKALSAPPHETLRLLWNKWESNTRHDEYNRVEAIKGQRGKGNPMAAKPQRRQTIAAALRTCPVGQWIDTEGFSRYMRAADFTFLVARDPFRLYICDRHYGHLGYDGFGGWNILQHRYLLGLLFEYAATLGMVDVAVVHPAAVRNDFDDLWGTEDLEWLSRWDGLRAFRITELGAYCLGMTKRYTPPVPETTLNLQTGTNLVIQQVGGTMEPADRLQLEAWAEPLEEGNGWRLTPGRALQAVERGQKAEDFADFLRARDPQPLPQTVEGFLATAERDGRAVRYQGQALLYECRDAETAHRICAHKDLLSHCRPCGDTAIAVPEAHADTFRKTVRALGLGVV